MQTFTLQSTYDNLPLAGILMEPQGAPRGIVQLVHGMAEHKGRYVEFMQFLAKNGYVAACHDHRGHGESIQKEGDEGWFGDFDGVAVVEDTVLVTKYLKTRYPNLPLTLLGHSMGSLVVRSYIQKQDGLIDKLVVCGSPSKNALAGVAIAIEKSIRLFRGKRHRSKFLKHLSTGAGAKRFEKEGKNAWLSRNRESVAAFDTDEKCGFIFTCNGYENLFKLLKTVYQKKRYALESPTLPILFIAGKEDPVIVNEKKWLQAIDFLRRVGYMEVTGKAYEGMRHEILNEVGREEVYLDVLAFLEQ